MSVFSEQQFFRADRARVKVVLKSFIRDDFALKRDYNKPLIQPVEDILTYDKDNPRWPLIILWAERVTQKCFFCVNDVPRFNDEFEVFFMNRKNTFIAFASTKPPIPHELCKKIAQYI